MNLPDRDYDLYGNFSVAEKVAGVQVRTIMQTHAAGKCSGEFCCIHNPSDHPLKEADLNWRADRNLMERICSHGIGHPDPDDISHNKRVLGERYSALAHETHGCDGCCR